ncbi:MAG: hypothetical protein IMZ60_00155 [Actinobacteria bacterium]|nr:hypothetical protein [Actinomycetota bacterium]
MKNKKFLGILICISIILILMPFISSLTYNTVNSVFHDFTWNIPTDSQRYILSVDVTSHKVGIGTLNPFQKLHVAGNILANGTINATGGFGVNGKSGLTANYHMLNSASVQCWMNYTGGIMTWSDC